MINDLKNQGEWKIQLPRAIKFFLLRLLKKLALCIQKVVNRNDDR